MNKRKMECKEPLRFCPQESLLKFCEIACGAELAAYGKEIARQIASRLVIRKGQGRVLETDLVRELVNVLDGKEAQLSNAVISSYACFIHGAKSLVEFDFPDESESNGLKRVTKELGDILLIFTVIDENIGGVMFQKMNFSQAKMAYPEKLFFLGKLINSNFTFLLISQVSGRRGHFYHVHQNMISAIPPAA